MSRNQVDELKYKDVAEMHPKANQITKGGVLAKVKCIFYSALRE